MACVGAVAVGVRLAKGDERARQVFGVLGVPIFVGLFGVAVALGTLGRVWSGPATLLSHLDLWGTATVAAVSSVLVNNLPAASLLSARTPAHPFALLIGLNLGPNLFVTGSLAWLLVAEGGASFGRTAIDGQSKRPRRHRRSALDVRGRWCARPGGVRGRRRDTGAAQSWPGEGPLHRPAPGAQYRPAVEERGGAAGVLRDPRRR